MFQPSDATMSLQLAEARAFANGAVLLRYHRRDVQGREIRDAQSQ
jgi:hypothetical protein